MQIRKNQMAAFEHQYAEAFVDRLTLLVKQQNTGIPPGVDDADLRAMVAHGVERARGHGLTWESSIGRFVGLMFAIAPNFDQHVPVSAVLADDTLPPDERVPELFRLLTPEQWTGAVRRYDLSAWPVLPK